MNTEPHLLENDPFGYLDDLQDGWADPDLKAAGPTGNLAVYRLALAQGRVLLWGLEGGADLARPLPPELAASATSELGRRLEGWCVEAARLGERWDDAIDPAEGEEFCARLLKFRMDTWAVQTAIDRAVLAAPADVGDPASGRLESLVDQFDRALEAQADILSTLTGTRLLENWRGMLAAVYRDNLPWWLDGRLEEVSRRLAEQADRTMPGPRAWTEVRRQADQEGRVPVVPWPSEDLLAAADTMTQPAGPGQSVCWNSPDGLWRAEVRVPMPLTPEQDRAPRPMNFTSREDDSPAAALAGWSVELGEDRPTINDQGQILVRLADLRFAAVITLGHQGQLEQWPLSVNGD
jgi:hypothetical protein